MSDATTDARIERVFEALDDRDADRVIEQFAPEGRFYEMPRGEAFSRAEFHDYLAEVVFELFPDYSVEQKQVLTAHDWATVVGYTFSATHEGEIRGTEPTGETVSLSIVAVITVSDDGITSWRDFFDAQALDEQLERE